MKANEYRLRVIFDDERCELLYQGESWYRANLIDRLCIRRNVIEIIFCRMSKIDPGKYLLTDANPVRYQLYRAVCFYLAVTGSLPPVLSIAICGGGQEFPIEKEKLTEHWENCCIGITMDAAVAARCFRQDGRIAYIALTYFLKAQLDKFPHDGFRAAWSGLNALYDGLVDEKKSREREKLKRLDELMRNNRMPCAEGFVQTLGDVFWKKLQWYNYIKIRELEEVEKDVFSSDLYRDAVLYEYLTRYVCGLMEKDAAEKVQQHRQLKKSRQSKKEPCINQQVRFLVCQYCYVLRNRTFHADRPYPIFGSSGNAVYSMDEKLTLLLLAVIKDVMVIQFGK